LAYFSRKVTLVPGVSPAASNCILLRLQYGCSTFPSVKRSVDASPTECSTRRVELEMSKKRSLCNFVRPGLLWCLTGAARTVCDRVFGAARD
jgi:hypothetical protein